MSMPVLDVLVDRMMAKLQEHEPGPPGIIWLRAAAGLTPDGHSFIDPDVSIDSMAESLVSEWVKAGKPGGFIKWARDPSVQDQARFDDAGRSAYAHGVYDPSIGGIMLVAQIACEAPTDEDMQLLRRVKLCSP